MKAFKEFLKLFLEAKEKKVVFQYGRFNPPTKGHKENIDFGVSYAKKNNSKYILFSSQSSDKKKNPLSFDTKTKWLSKMMNVNVNTDKSLKSPFHILEELGKTYSHVTFVVGEDRVKEFNTRMNIYAKDWGINTFEVIESGKRTKGVSGTDMREYVKNNDIKSFSENIPNTLSKDDIEELFNDVKKGLGL